MSFKTIQEHEANVALLFQILRAMQNILDYKNFSIRFVQLRLNQRQFPLIALLSSNNSLHSFKNNRFCYNTRLILNLGQKKDTKTFDIALWCKLRLLYEGYNDFE